MAALSPVSGGLHAIHESESKSEFMEFVRSLVPESHYYPPSKYENLIEKYSEEEIGVIFSDLKLLQPRIFESAAKELQYMVTAGPTGAGKSTLLGSRVEGEGFAYISQRSILDGMEQTLKMTPEEEVSGKWNNAALFIALTFLGYGIQNGYKIAHDSRLCKNPASVLEAPRTTFGYKIHLLHVTAPEAVCTHAWTSVSEASAFLHEAKEFYNNLPTYLTLSDHIDFYLRLKADEDAKFGGSFTEGELTTHNSALMTVIKTLHRLGGLSIPFDEVLAHVEEREATVRK